jgi:hypothetical protein
LTSAFALPADNIGIGTGKQSISANDVSLWVSLPTYMLDTIAISFVAG